MRLYLSAICRFLLLAILAVVIAAPMFADDTRDVALSAKSQQGDQPAKSEPGPIQDNSFLVEEAYNQEFGVVQHINTFMRDFNTHSWVYTFTQEWPVPGIKHQLSYTLSALNNPDSHKGGGFGDVALNYRYQLVGSGETRVAVAPRLTLLAPTGSARDGRGNGGIGLQTQIPLSVVILPKLVSHSNVGAMVVPRARNEFGDRARTTGYNLGQSFIWLAHPRFNVMLETVWAGTESVVGPGRTQRSHDLLISPGVRWAYNFANGLQIVPGVGVPMGVGPSAGEKGIFVYLSFEHPFRAIAKK